MVTDNFGEEAGRLYIEIYKKKSKKEIIASIEELSFLTMGDKNAKKQFADIFEMI